MSEAIGLLWYGLSNSRQKIAFGVLWIILRLSFSYSLILSSSASTVWQETVIAVSSLPFVLPWATFCTALSLPFVLPYRYLLYRLLRSPIFRLLFKYPR